MVKLMLKNNVLTYMYVLNYTIQGLNLPDWIGKCNKRSDDYADKRLKHFIHFNNF